VPISRLRLFLAWKFRTSIYGFVDDLFQLSDNINVQPKRGPVAQLGARFHGMEEVIGSIPTRSTIFPTTYSNHLLPIGSIKWQILKISKLPLRAVSFRNYSVEA
jgi:hypothetical protein